MPYSNQEREFLIKLGQRIRNLREAKGWSQERLAEECGLHRTYIGALERGERNVAALNLRKISSALGVSLSQLCNVE